MTDVLFIRTDAGADAGTGHFMRMLALAEAWAESGGQPVFAGSFPEALAQRAHAMGARVLVRQAAGDDVRWTIERAQEAGAKVVVADGYGFPFDFQRALRAAGLRLMVVDDNAENQPYDCDWILNVNVHATEAMYARRNSDAQCLLGPRFALIRAAIRRGSLEPRVTGGHRLLVTMGGADPPNATGRILGALRSARAGLTTTVLVGAANPRLAEYREKAAGGVTVLHDVQDVTPVMLSADVALAATGGTIWELALLGVPSVGLSLADNQVRLAEELQRRGAIDYAGDARTSADATQWLDRVWKVLEDPSRGSALLNASRALVDGNGARRVVERIKEI